MATTGELLNELQDKIITTEKWRNSDCVSEREPFLWLTINK